MKTLKALLKDAKIRASNKDVNAMKAMKVTMKAIKLRISTLAVYKLQKRHIIARELLEARVCSPRKAVTLATKIVDALRLFVPNSQKEKEQGVKWKTWNVQYRSDSKRYKFSDLWIDLIKNNVNEKWQQTN